MTSPQKPTQPSLAAIAHLVAQMPSVQSSRLPGAAPGTEQLLLSREDRSMSVISPSPTTGLFKVSVFSPKTGAEITSKLSMQMVIEVIERHLNGAQPPAKKPKKERTTEVRGSGPVNLSGVRGISPLMRFRVPAELKEAAEEKAAKTGQDMACVLRDLLRQWVQG
jgi:hypothetical protein